jgi:hypothetical protein
MLPEVLEQLIFKFGGVHYPMTTIARLDSGVMDKWFQNNCAFYRSFIQKWTPSYCNVLKWTPTIEHEQRYMWHYDVLTHLCPTTKERVENTRRDEGLVPIYPGDRQFPTSRVRYDPSYVNDRYFR